MCDHRWSWSSSVGANTSTLTSAAPEVKENVQLHLIVGHSWNHCAALSPFQLHQFAARHRLERSRQVRLVTFREFSKLSERVRLLPRGGHQKLVVSPREHLREALNGSEPDLQFAPGRFVLSIASLHRARRIGQRQELYVREKWGSGSLAIVLMAEDGEEKAVHGGPVLEAAMGWVRRRTSRNRRSMALMVRTRLRAARSLYRKYVDRSSRRLATALGYRSSRRSAKRRAAASAAGRLGHSCPPGGRA